MKGKAVSGVKKNYFVLKPINDNDSTIFAPTDNEHVLKELHRLLSKTEINKLIDSKPDEGVAWIINDNDRKEHYRKILASGNHVKLIRMIKSIYAHQKAREAVGKRLHMIDEHFFKDAEQILYNEFQYILELNSNTFKLQVLCKCHKEEKAAEPCLGFAAIISHPTYVFSSNHPWPSRRQNGHWLYSLHSKWRNRPSGLSRSTPGYD